jgi:hypothetical protein
MKKRKQHHQENLCMWTLQRGLNIQIIRIYTYQRLLNSASKRLIIHCHYVPFEQHSVHLNLTAPLYHPFHHPESGSLLRNLITNSQMWRHQNRLHHPHHWRT